MDGIALILEAEAAGLTIQLDGERLVIRGPRSADAIARRLLAEKPAVVAALCGQTTAPGVVPDRVPSPFADWVLRPDASGRLGWEAPGLTEAARPVSFDALPDLPDPCPQCGGLTFWWPIVGDRRCAVCHPPTAGIRALERADRIRQRLGTPSPAGAVELLADVHRLLARPENRNGLVDYRTTKV